MEIPIEKIWMAQKMMIKRCKVCCSVGIRGFGCFFPPRAAALGSSTRVFIHLGSGCGLGPGGILEGSERNLEPRYFPAGFRW